MILKVKKAVLVRLKISNFIAWQKAVMIRPENYIVIDVFITWPENSSD